MPDNAAARYYQSTTTAGWSQEHRAGPDRKGYKMRKSAGAEQYL